PPAPERGDVLRTGQSCGIAGEPGDPTSIFQFHLAQPQWIRNSRQKGADLRDRYRPDFHLDGAAGSLVPDQTGPERRPASQRVEAIMGSGAGGLLEQSAPPGELWVEGQPGKVRATNQDVHPPHL